MDEPIIIILSYCVLSTLFWLLVFFVNKNIRSRIDREIKKTERGN